jgi:DNA-binding beta-propeller fold protein YncE
MGEFPMSDMAVENGDQEMVIASLVDEVTVKPVTAATGATMISWPVISSLYPDGVYVIVALFYLF